MLPQKGSSFCCFSRMNQNVTVYQSIHPHLYMHRAHVAYNVFPTQVMTCWNTRPMNQSIADSRISSAWPPS